MYKILTTASKLRLVISKVVGPYQHSFIAGHQILDAALIADECLTHVSNPIFLMLSISLTSKRPMIMYLRTFSSLLERMGFRKKWRWDYFCISNVHFSVLVNDEATGFFPTTRVIPR